MIESKIAYQTKRMQYLELLETYPDKPLPINNAEDVIKMIENEKNKIIEALNENIRVKIHNYFGTYKSYINKIKKLHEKEENVDRKIADGTLVQSPKPIKRRDGYLESLPFIKKTF
jgi:DNA-binding PucR family transcriptional regulator